VKQGSSESEIWAPQPLKKQRVKNCVKARPKLRQRQSVSKLGIAAAGISARYRP